MTPLAVYQDLLDLGTQALMAGDFAAYRATLDLPYLLCTLHADFVLQDDADLRSTFDELVAVLRRNRVTELVRTAGGAVLAREDRIEGWHTTHLRAGANEVMSSYAARQVLVRRQAGWFVSESHLPYHADRLPLTEDVLRAALRPGLVPGAQPDLRPGLAWPQRLGTWVQVVLPLAVLS